MKRLIRAIDNHLNSSGFYVRETWTELSIALEKAKGMYPKGEI